MAKDLPAGCAGGRTYKRSQAAVDIFHSERIVL
jgi:hypothetical protein